MVIKKLKSIVYRMGHYFERHCDEEEKELSNGYYWMCPYCKTHYWVSIYGETRCSICERK